MENYNKHLSQISTNTLNNLKISTNLENRILDWIHKSPANSYRGIGVLNSLDFWTDRLDQIILKIDDGLDTYIYCLIPKEMLDNILLNINKQKPIVLFQISKKFSKLGNVVNTKWKVPPPGMIPILEELKHLPE